MLIVGFTGSARQSLTHHYCIATLFRCFVTVAGCVENFFEQISVAAVHTCDFVHVLVEDYTKAILQIGI